MSCLFTSPTYKGDIISKKYMKVMSQIPKKRTFIICINPCPTFQHLQFFGSHFRWTSLRRSHKKCLDLNLFPWWKTSPFGGSVVAPSKRHMIRQQHQQTQTKTPWDWWTWLGVRRTYARSLRTWQWSWSHQQKGGWWVSMIKGWLQKIQTCFPSIPELLIGF